MYICINVYRCVWISWGMPSTTQSSWTPTSSTAEPPLDGRTSDDRCGHAVFCIFLSIMYICIDPPLERWTGFTIVVYVMLVCFMKSTLIVWWWLACGSVVTGQILIENFSSWQNHVIVLLIHTYIHTTQRKLINRDALFGLQFIPSWTDRVLCEQREMTASGRFACSINRGYKGFHCIACRCSISFAKPLCTPRSKNTFISSDLLNDTI